MNITLRKANAVQNSILETIKSIKIETSVDINEFQDPEAELKRANDQLFANDARRQKLLLAYYNIRGLVGAANAQNGIDVNLTKAAFIDKRVAQLIEISSVEPYTDVEVIKGRLEKIKNSESKSRIYGYDDSFSTSVAAKEQIDQAKAEIQNLKKQKQKINDEVLEANIKTEIPLSEDVVATLTAEGLI
jgi:uncharacterized protein YdcH (DUF465 family)